MSESGFCVYQFSGTGNTRHAAGWLVDEAAARGLAARSVDLKHARDAPLPSPDDMVGIATPVHGFTAPWHVIRFASRIPRGRGSRAFVMTTRAGLAFGRFLLPGIGGTSTFLLALILWLRGYRVGGVMSVDMPSNWFSLHPIQRPHTHRRIVDASELRVRAFARRLLDDRRVWVTRNNLYELVWGLALVPVSLGYLLMGRFFLAKLFFANRRCDGCGGCVKSCPVGAVRLVGRRSPKPYWTFDCESCMRCASVCPHNAIEAGQSWGIALYFLVTLPVGAMLLDGLAKRVPALAPLSGGPVGPLLDVAYTYAALFLAYPLFHLALRLPIVNELFARTTFTHYWGRHRLSRSLRASRKPGSADRS